MIYNKNKRCNILELTHIIMVIRSFDSSTTAVSTVSDRVLLYYITCCPKPEVRQICFGISIKQVTIYTPNLRAGFYIYVYTVIKLYSKILN